LDNVDKIMWILPFLAIMDVISTFYVESQNFDLNQYEVGFFARLALLSGVIYVYAVIYVLIVFGFSYALWYIKKKLIPSQSLDKVIFVFLVAVAGYIYVTISATFIVNLFLPAIVQRGINWNSVVLVTYVATLASLVFYVGQDVIVWLRTEGEKKRVVIH
jgi:hypothetical protein